MQREGCYGLTRLTVGASNDLQMERNLTGVMTHTCRGSIIVLSISKSVEPNEEQKEMTSSFQ